MTVARIASRSCVVALLVAATWLFLPTTLGGSTTYVSTFGTSMEPAFSAGDLAILRPATGYRAGDVVAYRSQSLDTVVMHRIVRGDATTGFVMQGDNNSWLDEDAPVGEEILGRLWLRIPQGGRALETLRSPGVLALIGVAAVTVVGTATRGPRARRRSVHGGPPTARRPSRGVSGSGIALPARARAARLIPVAALIAVLGGVATAALLLVPATQTDLRTVQVQQSGRFAYAADAAVGTTYPTGRVETGDPIYTALIDDLSVELDQTLSAPGLTAVDGTLRLDVSVAAPDGWSAALPGGAATRFVGVSAAASVVLDPAAALDVLRRHYVEIGAAEGAATLTVTPVLDVTGSIEGRPFTAAPVPPLAFTLDAMSLRPAGDATPAATTSTVTAVDIAQTAPRSFAVGAVTVSLEAARIAAGTVLVLGMAALTATTWLGSSPVGPAARFAARNSGRLLQVRALALGSTVVDVADAEALQRVADRVEGLVLQLVGAEGATFAVQDGDTTYRCVLTDDTAAPAPAAVPVPRFA